MHHALSPDQRDEFTQLFDRYDANGDGLISREELREALRETSPSVNDHAVDGAMAALDDDGSGSVDLTEFLTGMAVFLGRPV
jgi:Ca2+-binding EF-hand superfamily protein